MALEPIPLKTPIVDKMGAINIFFRQRWEDLRLLTGLVAARVAFAATGQTAALSGQLIYTAVQGGVYRVTFAARRTGIDGVASTLAFTFHWTDGGAPFSDSVAVNATDTIGSLYTATRIFTVDQSTNLTCDMGYTSNTPAKMIYKLNVMVEQIAQV